MECQRSRLSEGKVQSCDLGKIKEKFKRDYPKVISRNGQDGQDRIFALKQNERDCPMTRKNKLKLRLLELWRKISEVLGVFFGTTILISQNSG